MAVKVERRTIDVVPEHESHGSPAQQFTLWFGANMQITAIVDGALAVLFGAEPSGHPRPAGRQLPRRRPSWHCTPPRVPGWVSRR